jgi:hypothetical protein
MVVLKISIPSPLGPDLHTGKGFAGLRKLCSEDASPGVKWGSG